MNCFMFPGQPLEGPRLLPDDADFREIAALVRERASLDLASFAWTGPERTDSVKLQVYGVAMSLYRARRLRREGIKAGLIAEHSMGIYAALAASASLPEGEALELAFRIGCAAARMGEREEYAIGCMVGLTHEPLMAIAGNNGVHLANYNTSRHFLLSGERLRMEGAVAEALASGAFSARTFPCDAPLHTPLLAEAADDIRSILSDYRYREPAVPLVNHIDQDCLAAVDLADFMLREMLMPVYWERTYLALRAAGAGRFFEAGAGESLRKYNRWIESQSM
ncbi:MAG TPA: acyltransferase domain-containing protein [Geobacteraceae bacterium]